ncbi:MAG: amphi-Trp domain-containing protein [Deltaproteobacteria bacterium]|nr:amphi-Trp domain-containing protein [Deltaproteobacteria bacterium]
MSVGNTMPKNSLTHNFVSDPDQVADFLRALIEGFRERKISVSSDGREQTVIPSEILDVTTETVLRKGRVRLNLSFSWAEVAPPKRDLFSELRPKTVDGGDES